MLTRRHLGFVMLTHEFKRENGWWHGLCRELGTATDGRSLPRVQHELHELVMLHLNELESAGSCESFFRDNGIKLYTDVPTEVNATVQVAGEDGPFVQVTSVEVSTNERELVPA